MTRTRSAPHAHCRARGALRNLVLFLGCCLSVRPALSAPPPTTADPAIGDWFRSLKQPGTEVSCCSMADCRTVLTERRGNQTWAFIGTEFPHGPNAWVPVPDDTIIRRTENPNGEPVACWFIDHILCFAPASEG